MSSDRAISIILCTRNRAGELARTLEALSGMSVPPDGAELKNMEVRYLYEPTPGLSSARNAGLRNARGEFAVVWAAAKIAPVEIDQNEDGVAVLWGRARKAGSADCISAQECRNSLAFCDASNPPLWNVRLDFPIAGAASLKTLLGFAIWWRSFSPSAGPGVPPSAATCPEEASFP